MLLPQMVQVIKHVYLSSVHPLAYDTQELQRENIRVVISLLEESHTPQFVTERVREIPFVKHQYYTVRDDPDQTAASSIRNIFFSTTKIILNAVDNERNVLVYCREGHSVCVTILIAYLLRCTYKNWHQYIIPVHDEGVESAVLRSLGIVIESSTGLPKTHYTWTETFLSYIQSYYPIACPNPGFLAELFEFERNLEKETKLFLC